ncbi:hypothetical protein [Promicromonospora sp. NPDC059942]|uniref:hypothetical protein n=1 Tax=Promicromonospora sp. NPDC059942 TaxID=3347009 RepID=UPI00365EF386
MAPPPQKQPATRVFSWRRLRAQLATQPTGQLVVAPLCLLLFWIPLAGLTTEHLARPLILDARRVTVEAVVEYRNDGRAGDSLDVRTLEEPLFSTTLHHWPRHLEVGDTFELTYDPQRPSRAAAVGAPWIDRYVIEFALLDLLVLPGVLLFVPVGAELAKRARAQVAAGRGLRRAHAAVVSYLRDDADTQPWLLTVTLFLLIPGGLVLASGGFMVVQAAQAAALYQRGASGTAVVEGTNLTGSWGGYADVYFLARAAPAGDPARTSPTHTSLTHLVAHHFELDVVEIVYDPLDPGNAIEAGAIPWGWQEWTATAVLVASGAFGVVSVPAAVGRLGRGSSSARQPDERSGADT